VFSFRRQPFVRLNINLPPVPRSARAQPVLLRSASQAEQTCAAIKHAQDVREQQEADAYARHWESFYRQYEKGNL
jgi:hypothetical protein